LLIRKQPVHLFFNLNGHKRPAFSPLRGEPTAGGL
jgi:hypothetical protein